jgi:hypothetical protein
LAYGAHKSRCDAEFVREFIAGNAGEWMILMLNISKISMKLPVNPVHLNVQWQTLSLRQRIPG